MTDEGSLSGEGGAPSINRIGEASGGGIPKFIGTGNIELIILWAIAGTQYVHCAVGRHLLRVWLNGECFPGFSQ